MSTNYRMNVILNHLNGPVTRKVSAKGYKYTLDNSILTKEQRDFYEENGFLVIRKLIPEREIDEYRQRFLDICDGKVSRGQMTLMREKSLRYSNLKGEQLYYKIQDIVWEDVLSKYVTSPLILDYVEAFVGPNIDAVHSMLLNKPPDSGTNSSEHPMHQDLHYFPFRPIDRIVASWTAMESIYKENGCLFVVPGTHKAILQPHDYPENDVNIAFHSVKGFDKVLKTDLIMEKGDTVFFHPCLFHGSYPNYTKGYRKAISCHYASSDCYYIDVTGTSQEQIAKEVIGIAKIKYGLEMPFTDTWRLRKRHVRGREGNLK